VPRTPEFHPEAQAEFEVAADRYHTIRPSLGTSYVAEVEEAVERALRAPATGAPLGPTLRRMFVRRFPYFVLYAADETRVFVLAVAHFRQRPGYWRHRR
jgi:plasmid stabilization system protein ParE